MAAVGALQNVPLQPVAIEVQPNPQDQRVEEATRSIFDRAKETVSRAWSATVIGFHTAFDKVSFVFFRVLEWVHPSLGPKIENVFLRVGNIWQSIKEAWRQEEIRKEMDHLKVQNHELQVKTRDYDRFVEQNGQLTVERDKLARENRELLQAKSFAEEFIRGAAQQEQNLLRREGVVVQYRDVVVLKNQQLQQENAQLIQERDQARQAMALHQAANQDLQARLLQAQQQAADLQLQMPNYQALRDQLELIGKAAQQVHRFGQKNELDDGIEGLLPLMRQQIELAKEKLTQAKQGIPAHSPAAIALQSFERIMNEVVGYLDRVPQALQLHANWQQPVDRLFLLQQQEVV